MPDDFGDYEDFDGEDFDRYSESVGSCDNCGCNLYEDDIWYLEEMELCNQCYWFAQQQ